MKLVGIKQTEHRAPATCQCPELSAGPFLLQLLARLLPRRVTGEVESCGSLPALIARRAFWRSELVVLPWLGIRRPSLPSSLCPLILFRRNCGVKVTPALKHNAHALDLLKICAEKFETPRAPRYGIPADAPRYSESVPRGEPPAIPIVLTWRSERDG